MKELDKSQREYVRGVIEDLDGMMKRSYLNVNLDQFLKDHNLLDELEVGKWHINTYKGVCIFNHQNDYNSYGMQYGSWVDGWHTEETIENTNWKPRLATPSEVETALIAEAKKRGFKEGVTIATPEDKLIRTVEGNIFYTRHDNCLQFPSSKESYRSCVIFSNGKWATIVEDEKPTLITELKELLNKYK